MLKVLIADDELYVREGIKNIISWNSCGFMICGYGIDYDDTYNKIFSLKPDLVLIDIDISGKCGLDVIRKAIENEFEGKFIIVSRQYDFNYLKDAIKYGVRAYLLKPINEEELIESINKIKLEIYKEIHSNENNEIKMSVIKEHVLAQLCLNSQIQESQELIKVITGEKFVISLISNYNNKIHDENIIEVEKCIKDKLRIGNVSIFKVKNRVAILFQDKNSSTIYSILEKLRGEIGKELKETLFITIGQEVNEINKITDSYYDAEDLMKKRYLYLKQGIISNQKINNNSSNKYSEDILIDKLYNYIEIGEIDKIKRTLSRLKRIIVEKNYEEEQVKVKLTTYYLKLKDKITCNYQLKELLESENKIIIEAIHNKGSLHEVIDVLIDKFIDISKKIAINSSDKAINRVVKYVDSKYYSDLKLEGLAKIFNYNSSYLGQLFKENMGKNFNTYLDTVRIDHAKKLLVEGNLKVYEVSEKVGYKSIDYFYCKFKKYVGISPLSYKKTLEKNQNIM